VSLPFVAAVAAVAALAGPWLRAQIFIRTVPYGQPPRQHCPHCGQLLVPAGWRGVAAVLPAGGDCPFCHTPIGPAGWLAETLAAATIAALAWRAPSWWLLAAWCWVGMLGLALALVDVAVKGLPDQLVAAAALAALAALSIETLTSAPSTAVVRAILTAGGLTVIYLVLVLLPGAGLGAGDAKLAVPIGLCLGYQSVAAVVAATIAGTLLAAGYVTVMLARHRIRRHEAIPSGPFMLLGALLAALIVR
jgi:leader peptidase (prepilin peptidase) / N-methyltransferase